MTFEEYLDKQPTDVCYKIALTAHQKLSEFDKPVCAISGGADSDVMLDVLEHCKPEGKIIDYVWFDTGIEFDATKRHLLYLEQRYGISVKHIRPKEPVPIACKKYGLPFISKNVSEYMNRLQKHNFDWRDGTFDELIQQFPNCKSALSWFTNNGDLFSIKRQGGAYLKEYLSTYPPQFVISNKCCDKAKKACAKEAVKGHDLNMFGVRKSEGGARSVAYKNCFSQTSKYGCAEYRPLFFMNNDDKERYVNTFDIKHSDCYTKYGLDRTGCVGCPFGRDAIKELNAIKDFEPQLYKAAWNIFGDALRYRQKYNEFAQEQKLNRKQ